MVKSSTLFECEPLPPYVHLASARRHSRDRCSQASPVFHRSSASVYCILNATKEQKRGRPGNEARVAVCACVGGEVSSVGKRTNGMYCAVHVGMTTLQCLLFGLVV